MDRQFSIDHLYQDKEWRDDLLKADEKIIYENLEYHQKVCGNILAVKKKIRFLPFNYLRVTFGPCIDYNSREIIEYALDRVAGIAKKNKSVYIQVNPFTWGTKNPDIIRILEEKGFCKTTRYIYEATIMLDLEKTEEELFKDFERRGREAVRQSERRGISSSEEAMTSENFDRFYTMYSETCERSGMIADDKDKICKTALHFAKRNKAFLFFANYENKPVCGFLAYRCGDCLSLIYQGSDYSGDLANRRPANNLYWFAIRWAKKQGYRWFDLAGVSLDAEKGSKSEGILLYKRQFGGEICVMPGNFIFVNRQLVKNFLDMSAPLYSRIALFLQRRRTKP